MKPLRVMTSAFAVLVAGCGIQSGGIPSPGYTATQADWRLVVAQNRADTPERTDVFGFDAHKEAAHQVICAEPSPDAIKAIAQSITASGSAGGTNAAYGSLQSSFGTSVGYIGMRTAMVQAVRDIAFYACTAYMNGALSYIDYERIMRGSPNIILGLEAIDALAGPAPAPTLTVNAPVGNAPAGGSSPPTPPAKPSLDTTTDTTQTKTGTGGATADAGASATTTTKTDTSGTGATTHTQQGTINQSGGRAAPTDAVAQAVVNVLCLTLYAAPQSKASLQDSNNPWPKVCGPLSASSGAGNKPAAPPQSNKGGGAVVDVVLAQNVMKAEGLYTGAVDGVSGPLTEAALKEYQSKHNLPTTAKLDADTKKAMKISG